MNEPANFVAGDLNKGCAADNKLNYPDYTPHVSFYLLTRLKEAFLIMDKDYKFSDRNMF